MSDHWYIRIMSFYSFFWYIFNNRRMNQGLSKTLKERLHTLSELLSCVWLFASPWTIPCMEFSRPEYWSGSVSSVAQSSQTLCDPMNHSTPGLPIHHQLPESTQTHVHRVGDTIQPVHPLSSPSPPALNLSKLTALCIRWPNIGVSASTSVLPMNTQDRSPLGGGVMIPSHFMTLK